MDRDACASKASEAVGAVFEKRSNVSLSKVKSNAKKLANKLNLSTLSSMFDSSNRSCLEMFFSVKTHKPEWPFRVIVSESGTWQKQLAKYLQGKLKVLTIDDPFSLKKSDEMIAFLKRNHGKKLMGCSIDIKDLYYTIPQAEIMSSVNELIDKHGAITFQNECGISTGSFLELLSFYLESTYAELNGECFIQKDGISIGSCIAPVLSDMFLASRDRILKGRFEGSAVRGIFRFVDDYFVFLECDNLDFEQHFHHVYSEFLKCLKPMVLTHEVPVDDFIRFLDLSLHFTSSHVCWAFEPRGQKPILPYSSAHSKLVKRALVHSLFRNAVEKTCEHRMEQSFQNQVDRLEKAGYPPDVLVSVAEKQQKELRQKKRGETKEDKKKRKLAVVPYLHEVSHNLRRIGKHAGVEVVFSAPNRLSSLVKKVNSKKRESRGCLTRHAKPFVRCQENVIYSLPLSCGKQYIGQTGRCLNQRLGEHSYNVTRVPITGHVAKHCRTCKSDDAGSPACEPLYKECIVIGQHPDSLARKIIEAQMIARFPDHCISSPSIALSDKEKCYLECEC